jgi:V8-like Glu-specific endopeptidase
MTNLTGQDWRNITKALTEAFPTFGDLERMMQFGIGESLQRIVANNANLDQAAFELLRWAKSEGRIEQLLVAARNEKPLNRQLRLVAEHFDVAPSSRLETVFSPGVALAHIEPFIAGLSQSELCVCRIEFRGDGIGTGFLISPSIIVTSRHVVEAFRGHEAGAESVIVRFDYKIGKQHRELSAGVPFRLAREWLIDASPVPELDYAFIALEQDAGELPIGGQASAPARKWLRPATHKFDVNENIFIIQHPSATPMKLGVGKVKGLQDDNRIVCHNADTLPGSSGSPCFSMAWELIAVHRQGKDQCGLGENNGAINFSRILEQPGVRRVVR